MTKEQFLKIEEQNGFDCAIEDLGWEEHDIVGLETLQEIIADEVADCVIMGEYRKAKDYITRLQDFDGVQYWYYNSKTKNLPKPLTDYSDVVFLLTND